MTLRVRVVVCNWCGVQVHDEEAAPSVPRVHRWCLREALRANVVGLVDRMLARRLRREHERALQGAH